MIVKISLLFLILGLGLIGITQAYADDTAVFSFPLNDKGALRFDTSINISAFFPEDDLIIIEDQATFAADLTKLQSVFTEQARSSILKTNDVITFDGSVDRLSESITGLNIEIVLDRPVGIISQEKWDEIINQRPIPALKDENAAPSLSGLGSHNNHRFTFGNVAEDPIFLTSTQEIHIFNLKATDRYVPVYVDAFHFYTIDMMDNPQDMRDGWLAYGNKPIPIPFGVFHHVTPEGQLVHLDQGNQKVFVKANGQISYYDDPENQNFAVEDMPEYSYAQQMALASWLRK